MARRRKPNPEAALNGLNELLEKPPETATSALKNFVDANYAKLIEAVEKGHSLTQIGAVLRKQGISSTPKLLKEAIYQAAVANSILDQLPEKLKIRRETGETEESTNPSAIAESSSEVVDPPEADESEPESSSSSTVTRLPVPETRKSKLAY